MGTKHFVDWVERQAQQLRRRLGLSQLVRLNPFQLADTMGARLISPSNIPGVQPGSLSQLLVADSDGWSAGSVRMPNGDIWIVLNPNHPETRKHATLMEELSHLHLGHTPTQLILIDGGPAFRSFNKTQETQAYWIGAAALVPRAGLERARRNKADRQIVAGYYKVSCDLVAFREKVTGLPLSSVKKTLR